MSLVQAFKGAVTEFNRLRTTRERGKFVADSAKLVCWEAVSYVTLIPYGVRTTLLNRGLAPFDPTADAGVRRSISVARDVRYGPAERNTMDIFLPASPEAGGWADPGEGGGAGANPPEASGSNGSSTSATDAAAGVSGGPRADSAEAGAELGAASEAGSGGSLVPDLHPVVLFVHGGVWATGEKWQFAPLAAALAQAGCVVCVMEYSLYPAGMIETQVQEVCKALTWAMDNINGYKGDPARISLLGHSSGAHISIMALLHRAAAHRRPTGLPTQPWSTDTQQQPAASCTDARMPARAVLMAGCYDLATHYDYEERRGVHMLSTMERAAGGWEGFAARSPAVIVAAAAQRERAGGAGEAAPQPGAAVPAVSSGRRNEDGDGAVPDVSVRTAPAMPRPEALNPATRGESFYSSFRFSGDAIAARIGQGAQGAAHPRRAFDPDSTDAAERFAADLQLDDLSRLPDVAILSSTADKTVPWHEGTAMYNALMQVPLLHTALRHLIYDNVKHADFVLDWWPEYDYDLHEWTLRRAGSDLGGFQGDVVQLVWQR